MKVTVLSMELTLYLRVWSNGNLDERRKGRHRRKVVLDVTR